MQAPAQGGHRLHSRCAPSHTAFRLGFEAMGVQILVVHTGMVGAMVIGMGATGMGSIIIKFVPRLHGTCVPNDLAVCGFRGCVGLWAHNIHTDWHPW